MVSRTLGGTDYPNRAPIAEVAEVMAECHGAIILGLRQIHIIRGIERAGTDRERSVDRSYLPTAWNNLEAGMAHAMGLPLMVIREEGVTSGIFDVGSSDRYVHQARLSRNWLESDAFLKPFLKWAQEVDDRRTRTLRL